MEPKENQRIALTKRLLQEGLLRLLEKKELTKITVTELCRESGINRATFYKYYGCPEDVLITIKKQFFQKLLELQQQDGNKSPMTYIESIGQICAYFYEHKELSKHIIKNIDFDISDTLKELSQGRKRIFEYLEKIFDPESAELASTFISCGWYSIIRHWLVNDIAKTPKEIEAIINKLLNKELCELPIV